KLEVSQEETRSDGTRTVMSYTAYVDTGNLENQRLELANELVIAAHGAGGWSTTAGILDDRPQTTVRAERSLNQMLFPLLLPYSLQMEGVRAGEARDTTLEGRKVWAVTLPFTKGFFNSPVLTTTWLMVVAQDDYSILSLDFVPPAQYRDISAEGIRYRILKQQDVEGAKIAEQLLLVGISPAGQESGHVRVTRIKASVHGAWDPALFLSPAELDFLEKD
ncbi:MAG: hypothetical protein OQK55_06290, partial [Thermoanaerobaculales bacterium]|nr:hypothetical protein [Thermoanaerobaculales bacterium]